MGKIQLYKLLPENFYARVSIVLLINMLLGLFLGGGLTAFLGFAVFFHMLITIGEIEKYNFLKVAFFCCFALLLNDALFVRTLGFGMHDAKGRGAVNLAYILSFISLSLGLIILVIRKKRLSYFVITIALLAITLSITYMYDQAMLNDL